MNKKVDLKDKFMQMIILGLDVYDLNDEIIELIKNYQVGGVVLYKNNYTSLDTMIDFVNKIKGFNKDGMPLFIAIDQENGRVNRFPKDVEKMYNALKIASTKDEKVVDNVNKVTTYLLKRTGVSMNFAPVLDIYRDNKNKAIGNRSYGKTEDIIKYGIPFMIEMQKNNIISVIKHFPGHGLTHRDSHFLLPKIKNVKLLKKEDINVFYKAIEYGADAIMVGHLKVRGYGNAPASINKKIINKLLLNKGYNGLVITDDLRMNSLRLFRRTKSNVKKSIEAGNNMMIIKYQKGDIKLYNKLIKMVNNCEIDPEYINNSYKKIKLFKEKYKINNDFIDKKVDLEKVNKKIKSINKYIDELDNI